MYPTNGWFRPAKRIPLSGNFRCWWAGAGHGRASLLPLFQYDCGNLPLTRTQLCLVRTVTEVAWYLSQLDPTVDRVDLVGFPPGPSTFSAPDLGRGSRDSHFVDVQLVCYANRKLWGKESKPVASADRAYRPVMMRDGRVPWEPRMKIDQRTSEPSGSRLSPGEPISFPLCIVFFNIQVLCH